MAYEAVNQQISSTIENLKSSCLPLFSKVFALSEEIKAISCCILFPTALSISSVNLSMADVAKEG